MLVKYQRISLKARADNTLLYLTILLLSKKIEQGYFSLLSFRRASYLCLQNFNLGVGIDENFTPTTVTCCAFNVSGDLKILLFITKAKLN